MNFFLDQEWLAFLERTGAISRACRLEVAGTCVWVGEYRNVRQKKWQLFGACQEHDPAWLDELFALGRQQGVFQVECAFNMARWTDKGMLEAVGARITEEFGTYEVDLSQEQERLWSGLHPKHRSKVNKGRRAGLEVRFDLNPDDFALILDETYARGGVGNPFSRSYLNALFAMAGERLLLLGVYSSDRLEAGAVVPMDDARGYFLHGAFRADGVPGAAFLMHWSLIMALKERGKAVYDIGGARRQTDDPRLAGIFRFKEGFGGKFLPCWYWCRVIHPGKKAVHDMVEWVRSRLTH
ncbi:MAG: GNAT family N-acetyltransferase [Magnetococcales bacterium]|nr:GNAT family N-acetyltransferase [Magnetococcales bacterium]MBF0151220.1 GNAT family N-acetyltransferase [Magnetococcales bacterium]MBF0348828.1 GNAT family N-acetyltransferase [Magnetococcales bacterium]MBF0632813.1 GNAT family N-acetyltransferase [Magnetococcales bacterium]